MTQYFTGKLKKGNQVIWFGGDATESGDSLSALADGNPVLLPPSIYNSLQESNSAEEDTENNEPEN